ncbi:hypothetical protein STEG23_015855 [Scotinomys teguina]
MASHSAEPQLLSMTPSCLQNQYHLGDSHTTPSPAANTSLSEEEEFGAEAQGKNMKKERKQKPWRNAAYWLCWFECQWPP